ncbi:MAG: alpha/beta hydrolase [Deltaproteobacteria bacterium]|uniref:Alpha/beta hydrolase n=1 Tax=Candidatus Zymogenus saltonus TaxID=2844893 RepID=A0A9D8KHE1_9DELT|nr:alpha/beta hydrolase [Candidatus Zymogenus saltonus]
MKSYKRGFIRSLRPMILLSMTIFVALACSYTPKIVDANGLVSERSIARIEKVNLGGVDQWIVMRGTDVGNPVLLFIHGGPGVPTTPSVIKDNGDLESDFVVVTWDQRGAGKSYSKDIPPESMTVEQIISDAHELVQYLKKKFNTDKIYIVGHSWGSILGMYLIDRYPGDFYAYVGIGQCVDGARNEALSYDFTLRTAEKTNNRKALKELNRIGPPKDGLYKNGCDDLLVQRKWLTKFGGACYGKSSYRSLYITYIFNEEYTIFDSLNVMKGLKFSLPLMWEDVMKIDFMTEIEEVEVPVYFMIGRHDWNTPFELAEEYFEALKAPKKEFIWFERSAHSPCFEEPERFNRLMVEKVKAETYKR